MAVGLAPDGGLFLPETLPDFTGELERFAGLGYAELCYEFLRRFATDIPADDAAQAIVARSYRGFTHPEIAPAASSSGENLFVLELFHGPTLAFKDFALQLLGNLYEHQCRVRGETINVLGATSGDTGAAAIHGLLGKPGVAIFILYPDGRVVAAAGAADGLHRRGQRLRARGRRHLRRRAGRAEGDLRRPGVPHAAPAVGGQLHQSGARAGPVRLLPLRLAAAAARRSARNVEFVVPTGNFGNVLAGWMLQKMGVPIRGFKVATNQNDILYRLFTTGEYRVAAVAPSLAPSMDIQVASNFERFLYYQRRPRSGAGAGGHADLQGRRASTASSISTRDTFTASHCTDAEIPGIIKQRLPQVRLHLRSAHRLRLQGTQPRPRRAWCWPPRARQSFPDVIRAAIGLEPTHPEPRGAQVPARRQASRQGRSRGDQGLHRAARGVGGG